MKIRGWKKKGKKDEWILRYPDGKRMASVLVHNVKNEYEVIEHTITGTARYVVHTIIDARRLSTRLMKQISKEVFG